MAVLVVKDLKKRYGDTEAVKGISFSVQKGEIIGLLGPNGAGKTTTISMVLGVLEPSEGTIHIAGFDVQKERTQAMKRTNFAAVYAQLPGNLTVKQNLNVFGRIYEVENLQTRIQHVMKEMDLTRFENTKAGVLSSGEQTRVTLAKAFLNKPELLLLDEPTASLDPSSAQLMREKIKAYADAGGAVLWTSHNMHEVTDMCDRVLFVSHGAVLLEGNPRELPEKHGKKDLEELFIAVAREPLSITE
ncbi:heme ABC exporter, ATP-binding protein CcmA [Candidatus Kaiserbacteria bacterium RIFCSPHIGHO2_01_FULL_56_24]|uniref:Heme ABC exporter, ATP-binding protein CcmA n=1 Tax=Candidatus Kaiserbacteria bacterium RIFCSPHIGHO2_01_FULL_56_24 TaxID=1798487 RepID=A0A1F6DE85_9BACT|nr:MAG: heme ABC exporter, ATP-binding protein CcmA [Candidatus Kaiserbacteria bacterium RIFCSPHIGHO2_01_FULL_56_24]